MIYCIELKYYNGQIAIYRYGSALERALCFISSAPWADVTRTWEES